MEDFKTDNQDKSNLVGDAEEIIRLKDEVRELREKVIDYRFILTCVAGYCSNNQPNDDLAGMQTDIESLLFDDLDSETEYKKFINDVASIKGES